KVYIPPRMTRYSVSPRGSDRSMVGLNRPFADQFRTTSFMHCSPSFGGTSVRITGSWAGCHDCIVVSGLPPDREVFLLTSPFIDRYLVESMPARITGEYMAEEVQLTFCTFQTQCGDILNRTDCCRPLEDKSCLRAKRITSLPANFAWNY